MKTLGIILIIAGVLMMVFRNITFTKEEKVADLGPVEINKKEHKTIGWPVYAGAVAIVGGLVLVISENNRRTA
jgi:uncharacterized membrane protein HdeD (DUF308 family)